MKNFEIFTKPLMWFMALALATVVVGCGGSGSSEGSGSSSAKAITAYSIAGVPATINEGAKTIAVTLPFGTPVVAQVATFTTTGASVKVGTPAVAQISGTTPNNFSGPVAYIVTAANATTATYTVTVTVAASSAKAMTAFSLAWTTGTPGSTQATIDEVTKTIVASVPNATDVTALIATYITTGASVNVGTPAVTQTSGTTPNNFSGAVVYIVTAADSSTATYMVTVTVATAGLANPTAPVLGEAGRFVILASAGVTGGAGSLVNNGDIGVSPAARTLITGFTPIISSPSSLNPGGFTELTNGWSYAPEDSNTVAPAGYTVPFPYPLKTGTVVIGEPWATTGAMLTQAMSDLTIAYNFLAFDPNPGVATTVLADPELGGKTLTRGVYKTTANLLITTPLQLDAQGDVNAVWIFSTDGNLTTGATGNISFVGGVGSAKNVYWRVAGTTTIASSTTFYGNVYGHANVDVHANASVTGSLFSTTASVTLITNTITKAP